MHIPGIRFALASLLALMLDELVLAGWRDRRWGRLLVSVLGFWLLLFLGVGSPMAWPAVTLLAGVQLAALALERRSPDSFARLNLRIFGVWLTGMLAAAALGLLPAGAPGWFGQLGRLHIFGLLLLTALVATIPFGGRWVERLIQPLAAQLPERTDRLPPDDSDRADAPRRGFLQGGRLIGYLERSLILLLVLIGEAGAIGFLAAAKSIFRFGEIRERENRVEAEYILIGTLASFLWALLCASLLRWLLPGG